ncbi:MAG TPA: GDSL-type esterase/lipase family protein [Solirubrobacteraceae bacterium]|nr:GDSL-type esterase/lipase family protein [Solirubrobacteraceae bacterium]
MTGDLPLGVLAFGDSITNGGGELQWGVALQSWALWVARGLGLPYTSYAVDGADVHHVVEWQIPAFTSLTAHPGAGYELGCLYIGVNDVRRPEFDVAAFARDYGTALDFLTARCRRTMTMTAPLDLGRPRAGAKVGDLNAAIEDAARERGVLVVDLRGLRSRNLVMADHVHPTALGQVAIAERALGVLARDGLAPAIMPSSLITYQATRWGRLRGDMTYAYRSAKYRGPGRVTQAAARRLRSRRADAGPGPG